MIRNRIASILADRGIKISRASLELPNLSRNTITNTASNSGKMIQLETIDTLCQYLNITPSDFFEYLPFDLDFTTDITDNQAYTNETFDFINVPTNGIKLDFFIKKTYSNGKPFNLFEYSGILEVASKTTDKLYINLLKQSKNDFENVWDHELTSGFRPSVWNDIKENIASAINLDMFKRFPQSGDDFVFCTGDAISLKTNFYSDIDYEEKPPF